MDKKANVVINEYSSGESHAMSKYLNKHATAENDQCYGKKKAGEAGIKGIGGSIGWGSYFMEGVQRKVC